jgi:xylose isomerase
MSDTYTPKPEHKFTFGLWTVGNRGADPFGPSVRGPRTPMQLVELLGSIGAYGVNFHDDDLIPLGTSASKRAEIISDFKKALADNNVKVPMVTTNLFSDPCFKDGAYTSHDPKVRAYALQKTMINMELGQEMGAEIYVFWGGREGTEVDAGKCPVEALKNFRECMNYLCEYSIDNGYNYKFAMEAKPNEPRSDIYLPTTGAFLAFIETLDHPEMVGVNPETAHEVMAGLNMTHAVAQAWDADKLFHIDLNDQKGPRFDQDLRFGSANMKNAFTLVKFLEDVGYSGSRHFDAHAFRTEDINGVTEFAKGCMRTYLIFKEKAKQFNEDPAIQACLAELKDLQTEPETQGLMKKYSKDSAAKIKATEYDRVALAEKGLGYERLDQLTVDLLMGVSAASKSAS